MIHALAAALALAVPSTSSVVVDRTVSCQVPQQAGIPIFTLRASPVSTFVGSDGKRGYLTAGLWVYDNDRGGGSGVALLGVANVFSGYASPAAGWCKAAPRIPLAPSGVPREGVYASYSSGLGEGLGSRCMSAARVTIRLRATILKGVPVAAQLAVRSGAKQRPIAFVRWTPKKVTTYLTDDCQA